MDIYHGAMADALKEPGKRRRTLKNSRLVKNTGDIERFSGKLTETAYRRRTAMLGQSVYDGGGHVISADHDGLVRSSDVFDAFGRAIHVEADGTLTVAEHATADRSAFQRMNEWRETEDDAVNDVNRVLEKTASSAVLGGPGSRSGPTAVLLEKLRASLKPITASSDGPPMPPTAGVSATTTVPPETKFFTPADAMVIWNGLPLFEVFTREAVSITERVSIRQRRMGGGEKWCDATDGQPTEHPIGDLTTVYTGYGRSDPRSDKEPPKITAKLETLLVWPTSDIVEFFRSPHALDDVDPLLRRLIDPFDSVFVRPFEQRAVQELVESIQREGWETTSNMLFFEKPPATRSPLNLRRYEFGCVDGQHRLAALDYLDRLNFTSSSSDPYEKSVGRKVYGVVLRHDTPAIILNVLGSRENVACKVGATCASRYAIFTALEQVHWLLKKTGVSARAFFRVRGDDKTDWRKARKSRERAGGLSQRRTATVEMSSLRTERAGTNLYSYTSYNRMCHLFTLPAKALEMLKTALKNEMLLEETCGGAAEGLGACTTTKVPPLKTLNVLAICKDSRPFAEEAKIQWMYEVVYMDARHPGCRPFELYEMCCRREYRKDLVKTNAAAMFLDSTGVEKVLEGISLGRYDSIPDGHFIGQVSGSPAAGVLLREQEEAHARRIEEERAVRKAKRDLLISAGYYRHTPKVKSRKTTTRKENRSVRGLESADSGDDCAGTADGGEKTGDVNPPAAAAQSVPTSSRGKEGESTSVAGSTTAASKASPLLDNASASPVMSLSAMAGDAEERDHTPPDAAVPIPAGEPPSGSASETTMALEAAAVPVAACLPPRAPRLLRPEVGEEVTALQFIEACIRVEAADYVTYLKDAPPLRAEMVISEMPAPSKGEGEAARGVLQQQLEQFFRVLKKHLSETGVAVLFSQGWSHDTLTTVAAECGLLIPDNPVIWSKGEHIALPETETVTCLTLRCAYESVAIATRADTEAEKHIHTDGFDWCDSDVHRVFDCLDSEILWRSTRKGSRDITTKPDADRQKACSFQRPIRYLMSLILMYSEPTDLVLCPIMDCGSAAVACALTCRQFIGITDNADTEYYTRRRISSILALQTMTGNLSSCLADSWLSFQVAGYSDLDMRSINLLNSKVLGDNLGSNFPSPPDMSRLFHQKIGVDVGAFADAFKRTIERAAKSRQEAVANARRTRKAAW